MSLPSHTILAALRGTPETPPARPDVLAQAMELRDRFARFHDNPHSLAPGSLVMEKRGIGLFKPSHREQIVLVVWRLLDPCNAFDRDFALNFAKQWNCCTLDCVVAYVSDDASHLQYEPRALSQLEPWVERGSEQAPPLRAFETTGAA